MHNLAEIAGSRLMTGFNDTRLTASLEHFIKDFKIGGVILFRRNIENPKQLAKLCENIQECAKDNSLPPLFIAIDQEGGNVSRLGVPFTQFPKGAPGLVTVENTVEFAEITALELNACNINMDMAPVLDVAPKGFGSFMEKRALGATPESVAKLGLSMILSFQSNGIIPVGKHFPGIGRTIPDSHIELPVFDDTLDSLRAFDLIPFRDAIEAGLEAVMLAHILYTKLDDAYPASLSANIVKGLLREDMGFGGVVMTDDMDMGAIAKNYGYVEAVTKALAATVDIILICHESEKIEQAFNLLLEDAENHPESAQESYERIMRLKDKYLLDAPAAL